MTCLFKIDKHLKVNWKFISVDKTVWPKFKTVSENLIFHWIWKFLLTLSKSISLDCTIIYNILPPYDVKSQNFCLTYGSQEKVPNSFTVWGSLILILRPNSHFKNFLALFIDIKTFYCTVSIYFKAHVEGLLHCFFLFFFFLFTFSRNFPH